MRWRASPSTVPIATTRSPWIPTSARRPRRNRAVDDLATLDHHVEHVGLPRLAASARWAAALPRRRPTGRHTVARMDLIDALRSTGAVRESPTTPFPTTWAATGCSTRPGSRRMGGTARPGRWWSCAIPRRSGAHARPLPPALVRVPRVAGRRAHPVRAGARSRRRGGRSSGSPSSEPAAEAAQSGGVGFAEEIHRAPVLLAVLADQRYLAVDGPRLLPLHDGGRRVDLPVRVEHPARRTRRRPRRRAHHRRDP